nr:MAG TPA: hypothetical protein [Caudoviricetes sp.]
MLMVRIIFEPFFINFKNKLLTVVFVDILVK